MLLGLEKNDEAEALGSGQGHPSYWEWQVHLLQVDDAISQGDES